MDSRERYSHVVATIVSRVKFAAVNIYVTFRGMCTVM